MSDFNLIGVSTRRLVTAAGGGGPTLIYSEDFSTTTTVESIASFDADWAKDSVASDNIYVSNTVARAIALAGSTTRSYWNGTGLVADQSIHADVVLLAGTDLYPGLMVRMSGSGEGYLAEWSAVDGAIILYRVTSDWGTFTQLGSNFGTVSASTTYTGAFLKATGTGATVTLEYGDDTNGTATPFDDTDASRHTSGYVGLTAYLPGTESNGDVAFDNLEIYDES